jgi:hypothetical protein
VIAVKHLRHYLSHSLTRSSPPPVWCALATLLLWLWCAADPAGCLGRAFAAEGSAANSRKSLRVLFVGNSFTRGNDLPAVFAALVTAGQPTLRPDIKASFLWNATLEEHWRKGNAAKAIAGSGTWDYVVLQEQSARPFLDAQATLEYASAFNNIIVRAKARTVLYMTWVDQGNLALQPRLTKFYQALGRRLGATVAPVGQAWAMSRAERPEITLHGSDGHHANAAGTYLTACVFYTTLLNRSPVGLPADLSDPASGQHLLSLAPQTATWLQNVAGRTVASRRP